MRISIYLLCLTVASLRCYAQGLVKFSNSTTTLVSGFGNPGFPYGAIPPNPGTYYFALLTAPMGTTDPYAFTFAGIYATNTAATTGGRFQGGPNTGVAVSGWAGGTSRAFEIAGWSSDLGPTWNPSWLGIPPWLYGASIGLSPIGQGVAGGIDSLGNPLPALVLVGAPRRLARAGPWHGFLSRQLAHSPAWGLSFS